MCGRACLCVYVCACVCVGVPMKMIFSFRASILTRTGKLLLCGLEEMTSASTAVTQCVDGHCCGVWVTLHPLPPTTPPSHPPLHPQGKYSAANYANHIATVLDTLKSNVRSSALIHTSPNDLCPSVAYSCLGPLSTWFKSWM